MAEENKNLIEILSEKGILKTWHGNPDEYFGLEIRLRDNLCVSGEENKENFYEFYIPVKKDELKRLVEGSVDKIRVNLQHEELERRSLYHDEVVDVKVYDGTVRLTFDREKLAFNFSVSGHSYWDTGFF